MHVLPRQLKYTFLRIPFATLLLFLLLPSYASAQVDSAMLKRPAALSSSQIQSFPDYLAIRSEFLSQVVTAAPSVALRFRPVFRNTQQGRVRISMEREQSVFYVLFQYERNGEFPYAAKGNIIIRRAVSTGFIESIKWILSEDGLNYLELSANNEKTLIDYVVAGSLVNQGVQVNVMIYYFLLQPFSYLHNNLQRSINWKLAFPEAGRERALRLIEALKSAPQSDSDTSQILADPAGGLLQAAAKPELFSQYLEDRKLGTGDFKELNELPFRKYVSEGNTREHEPETLPTWRADTGFALKVLPAAITFDLDSVYFALINCKDGKPTKNIVLVPFVNENGQYDIYCRDALSPEPLQVNELLHSCVDNELRLFSLPLAGIMP